MKRSTDPDVYVNLWDPAKHEKYATEVWQQVWQRTACDGVTGHVPK